VNIPNSLLQKPYKITAYVCIYEDVDTFVSLYAIDIPVKARPKPGDYTIEANDEEIYSFNTLENMFSSAYEKYTEASNLYVETVENLGTNAENAQLAQECAERAESAKARAEELVNAVAVIDMAQITSAEEADALSSPSFANYVNWGADFVDDVNSRLVGIMTMGAGYYKTQLASIGGKKPALMVRNIDTEGGMVYPWEWINPPMEPGVEYRTTERFNGKPVYRCCFKDVRIVGSGSVTIPTGAGKILEARGFDHGGVSLNGGDHSYRLNNSFCFIDCPEGYLYTFDIEIKYIKDED
jgi:hypothetical protein